MISPLVGPHQTQKRVVVFDADSNTEGYNLRGAGVSGGGWPFTVASKFGAPDPIQNVNFPSHWQVKNRNYEFHVLANGSKSVRTPNLYANAGASWNSLNNEAMYSRLEARWRPGAVFCTMAGLVDFLPASVGGTELTPAALYSEFQTLWARTRGYGYKIVHVIFPYSQWRTQADQDSLASLVLGDTSLYDAVVDNRSLFTYANANANTSDSVHLIQSVETSIGTAVFNVLKQWPYWGNIG